MCVARRPWRRMLVWCMEAGKLEAGWKRIEEKRREEKG
jgi:hypothetical protein